VLEVGGAPGPHALEKLHGRRERLVGRHCTIMA
jgi:hypothetical protein